MTGGEIFKMNLEKPAEAVQLPCLLSYLLLEMDCKCLGKHGFMIFNPLL